MTRVFDESFDPLMDLQMCKERILHLEQALGEVIKAHNAQVQLTKQIAQQNTEILTQMALQRQYLETFFPPHK